MKINITIDCEPSEVKEMLNLPDLGKVIEEEFKKALPQSVEPITGGVQNPFWWLNFGKETS